MGFWDVTKRMLQGKPAFEAPKSTDDWDSDAPTIDYSEERAAKRAESEDSDLYDENGYKHPPVVSITNVKDELHSDSYDLWLTIHNHADREVVLDKMTLLGAVYRMTYPLHANDQRVFHAYHGPKLTQDSYKKAELYYKDVLSGDYFRADHLLHYKYDTDGTYEVVDFEPIMPIRDV